MPQNSVNAVYFRNARRVLLPVTKTVTEPVSDVLLATFLKNVEAYGFTFDTDTIRALLERVDADTFTTFAAAYVAMLQRELGAHVQHQPMYPNFPQQVMDASAAELYLNAILHYFGDWVGVRIMPVYDKDTRLPLTADEFNALDVIKLGDEGDFFTVFTNLVGSKLALGETGRADVAWFIDTYKAQIAAYLPDDIRNRENLATVAGYFYALEPTAFEAFLFRTKTVTDVLRVAAAISDSDVSLAANVKFITFNKAARRSMLARLEQLADANEDTFLEDFARNRALWKMLGEKLHPGDYRARYPRAYKAFEVLRSGQTIQTYRGLIEAALQVGDVERAVTLLAARPGELARRLDHLLRIGVDQTLVLDTFRRVAPRVASNVLWQVRAHFLNRANSATRMRAFFPKGSLAKVYGIENNLPALSWVYADAVVRACDEALRVIYGERENLGAVYLDPNLGRYTVPNAIRNASRALNVIGRGTRIPLSQTKEIARFFIWWKDGHGRTDLDLSAVLLNDKFEVTGELAYYNLRDLGAVHSGDITSAPHGASEYIDIDLAKLRARKVAYVMMVVNAYTSQHFTDLPECFAGVMSRKAPQSGEVYEPRTVENIFDLTADTRIAAPLLIDVNSREFIWADLALKHYPHAVNNVRNNRDNLATLVEAIVSLRRPTLLDLFTAHANARGHIVTDRDEADTVFDIPNGHSTVPMTEILADYV